MRAANDGAVTIVAKALSLDLNDVPRDAGIDSFPPWDSLGHLRIILLLEETILRPLTSEEVLQLIDLDSINALLTKVSGIDGI